MSPREHSLVFTVIALFLCGHMCTAEITTTDASNSPTTESNMLEMITTTSSIDIPSSETAISENFTNFVFLTTPPSIKMTSVGANEINSTSTTTTTTLYTTTTTSTTTSDPQTKWRYYRKCQSELSCVRRLSNDTTTTNKTRSNIYCIDEWCTCSIGQKTAIDFDAATGKPNGLRCLAFVCNDDEECRRHDRHSSCNQNVTTCVCNENYHEESGCCIRNLPVYMKTSRKYFNKNRITYRENIEHLTTEKPQVLWVQYATFVGFFIGQVVIISNYVIIRRKQQLKKLLKQQQQQQQNGVTV